MTHCIMLNVKIKRWKDVEMIWNNISKDDCDGNSAMSLYRLKKHDNFKIMSMRGLCPHIYFPENEKEKEGKKDYYQISVQTGSHCSWYDTSEIVFMWTFWVLFLRELEMFCIDYEHEIRTDGKDEVFIINQAWKKIIECDKDLRDLVVTEKR